MNKDHTFFQTTGERSRRLQRGIREATFAPDKAKTLRRFSTWEIAELIFRVNLKTLQKRLQEPEMPEGALESEGHRQRWFSLEDVNRIRKLWKQERNPLLPFRPKDRRAIRVGISNFKGGSGKSTVALHFAHAAALDGYRVLLVDFDPQATLSHAMGIVDVFEEKTVWGIIARDLIRETDRMNYERQIAGRGDPLIEVPEAVKSAKVDRMKASDFIQETCWPTIDIIPSCANAAFVEFATGEYRMRNRTWSFFASMDRFLDRLPHDLYDVVIFDNPPAIGYQALNAVFAADVLYVPSGPAYWEYDSTTSFIVQLGDSLAEIASGFTNSPEVRHKLPKAFKEVKFLLTRYESNNELHGAMQEGLKLAFGDSLTKNPVELTRAVEQTGRLQQSIYEIDYRGMTRETWRRARRSFDAAYEEFRDTLRAAWLELPVVEASTSSGRTEAA